MKYILTMLIIITIVAITILFVKLMQIKKKLIITNYKANKITNNIEEINNKIHSISKKDYNIKAIASSFIILKVLKEAIANYKSTKKQKRSIVKSLGKTCIRNVGNISKISF